MPNNKTIAWESHSITHLAKELTAQNKQFVEEHLEEINRKFTLLLNLNNEQANNKGGAGEGARNDRQRA